MLVHGEKYSSHYHSLCGRTHLAALESTISVKLELMLGRLRFCNKVVGTIIKSIIFFRVVLKSND